MKNVTISLLLVFMVSALGFGMGQGDIFSTENSFAEVSRGGDNQEGMQYSYRRANGFHDVYLPLEANISKDSIYENFIIIRTASLGASSIRVFKTFGGLYSLPLRSREIDGDLKNALIAVANQYSEPLREDPPNLEGFGTIPLPTPTPHALYFRLEPDEIVNDTITENLSPVSSESFRYLAPVGLGIDFTLLTVRKDPNNQLRIYLAYTNAMTDFFPGEKDFLGRFNFHGDTYFAKAIEFVKASFLARQRILQMGGNPLASQYYSVLPHVNALFKSVDGKDARSSYTFRRDNDQHVNISQLGMDDLNEIWDMFQYMNNSLQSHIEKNEQQAFISPGTPINKDTSLPFLDWQGMNSFSFFLSGKETRNPYLMTLLYLNFKLERPILNRFWEFSGRAKKGRLLNDNERDEFVTQALSYWLKGIDYNSGVLPQSGYVRKRGFYDHFFYGRTPETWRDSFRAYLSNAGKHLRGQLDILPEPESPVFNTDNAVTQFITQNIRFPFFTDDATGSRQNFFGMPLPYTPMGIDSPYSMWYKMTYELLDGDGKLPDENFQDNFFNVHRFSPGSISRPLRSTGDARSPSQFAVRRHQDIEAFYTTYFASQNIRSFRFFGRFEGNVLFPRFQRFNNAIGADSMGILLGALSMAGIPVTDHWNDNISEGLLDYIRVTNEDKVRPVLQNVEQNRWMYNNKFWLSRWATWCSTTQALSTPGSVL